MIKVDFPLEYFLKKKKIFHLNYLLDYSSIIFPL